METTEKAQLIEQLKEAMNVSGLSNNVFALERLGVTKGMMSQILNHWDKPNIVGENTWNLIIKYLEKANGYKGIASKNLKKVAEACLRAYEYKVFIPLIGEGGYGKTVGLEWFKRHQESIKGFKVYYINCEKITTGKQLVIRTLETLGISADGTIRTMIDRLKAALEPKDCLLQFDEISSLKDHRITIIKDIMTALKGICGIVFAGTPYFMDNLNKGASKNKHLFCETRDRLFNIVYTLDAPTDEEAEQIFSVNGLGKEEINILMGRNSKKEFKQFAWFRKPTFRGISDAIVAVRIALSETQIIYPLTFEL